MPLSTEDMRKLEYLWQDGNEIEWIEAFIKIADKSGKIVPFIPTDEQRKFVEEMENQSVVLKSRQLGISSIVVALSIRACIVHPNTTCLLVSHSQKSTNTIFDKLKQQYNSVPDFIKSKLMTNNRQELKMSNGSKITCTTAGNQSLGRGDTLNGIVHLSEFAFWKNPEKQLNSITQAVSESGKILIESTACGLNMFADTYYQSQNGENSYKAFFFNWINGRGLFEKQYQQAIKKYRARHGKLLTVDELDEEEMQLLELGATIEQLIWRRDKINDSSLEDFHVEYPATDIECFINTGANIFDNKRIDTVEKSIIQKKEKYIPKSNISGIPVTLQNHYGRSLFIYDIPKPNQRYYVGVDCSEGIGSDSSCAIVLDKDGKEVAMFKNNKIKPYEFAGIINDIGRYYNKALLTVEKASGGHSVLERLRYDYSYMNMHKYKSYDEFNRERWQVGFDTNNKTKSIIVNDCREMFECGQIQLNSKEILEEMKVFSISDTGKMGAISGRHDDLVMSLCLAIAGMKSPFYYSF